jgi:uncharacterized protein YbaR (Trm112 family)
MAQDLKLLQEFGVCCPVCRGDLTLLDDHSALDCPACAKRYRIEDDIPILLAEEATPLGQPAPGAPQ